MEEARTLAADQTKQSVSQMIEKDENSIDTDQAKQSVSQMIKKDENSLLIRQNSQ